MTVGLVWAGVPEPMKARGVGCPLARATGSFWPPDRVQDSNLCPYPKNPKCSLILSSDFTTRLNIVLSDLEKKCSRWAWIETGYL